MQEKQVELTFRSISLAILLAIVMGAANLYLGLKIGMTVSASIPAAVVAMIIFRRKSGANILEANQVQTAASAGESIAAGVIFTLPALVLLGLWQEFNYLTTTLIALSGGFLGIILMIPMRETFIVQKPKELRFPEALACAEVLKAGCDPKKAQNARPIIQGVLIGCFFKLAESTLGIFARSYETAWQMGKRFFYFGTEFSPVLLAVGFIVKLPIAACILIGTIIGWCLALPLLSSELNQSSALDTVYHIWSTKIRYIGVGAMIIGGVSSIWTIRKSLLSSFKILLHGNHNSSSSLEDLPRKITLPLGIITIITIAILYTVLTGNVMISLVTTPLLLILAFFFTAVASYIAGLVGMSNSPVSGMVITVVIATALILLVFGFSGSEGMIATLCVAAVVCCTCAVSGDICNDLKTGQIVGASPRNQQIMQMIGITTASLVLAPVLQLLHDHTPGGIGGPQLNAPQASLFAGLVKGFFTEKPLETNMILIGMLIGLILLATDQWLSHKKINFRCAVMPAALGIYLPFALTFPIFIGGLVAYLVEKIEQSKNSEKKKELYYKGMLCSSGVIAGEALTGIFLALLASFGFSSFKLVSNESIKTFASLSLLVYLIFLLGLRFFKSEKNTQ